METGGLALTAISTEFRLDGKTAVVTGGGSGIGRAVALKFAAAGADVRILEINEKSGSAVADEIAASGGSASFHSCDVTDQAAVSELLSHIARRGRIHILVNNAGISHVGSVETTTEEDFDRVLRVNVKGYYNCTRAALGRMKENGGGVILNMASVAGSAGLADRFAYSTSKGAVIAMTLPWRAITLHMEFDAIAFLLPASTLPLWMITYTGTILAASRRCTVSSLPHSQSDVWPSRKKLRR